MRHACRKFALLVLMIAPVLVQSQSRERVTQATEWFGTSSAIRFTPKFGVYLDGQYRFSKGMHNMQHQFRTAFDIYVNDQLMISPVGYVHIWNFLYGDQPASVVNNEHRLYQQLQYKHHAGKFFFTHRFRTEERFIQFHSGTPPLSIDEGFDENFQFRIRHRVWCNYALTHDRIEPGTWYLASLFEWFMSWGERVTYDNKIDQYRIFGGLGYQFNRRGNIQAGPFYQYLVKKNGLEQENNVGFYLQLNYNLDLFNQAVK